MTSFKSSKCAFESSIEYRLSYPVLQERESTFAKASELLWKRHSFSTAAAQAEGCWHASSSKPPDSSWNGQMRRGKYFKLVHLSC